MAEKIIDITVIPSRVLCRGTSWYPPEQWGLEDGSKDYEMLNSKFEEPHGDRRQEIVFIGTDLKEDAIREALDNRPWTIAS